MSAQANLNGLYPPKSSGVWRKNVNWQPIPIHPGDPRVLFTFRYGCPLYNKLLVQADSSEEFKNLNKLYESMFKYISEYTNSSITNLSEAYYLYDALHIEEQMGYPLPSWTHAVYPEPIRTLALTLFEKFVYDDQMKKLCKY